MLADGGCGGARRWRPRLADDRGSARYADAPSSGRPRRRVRRGHRDHHVVVGQGLLEITDNLVPLRGASAERYQVVVV